MSLRLKKRKDSNHIQITGTIFGKIIRESAGTDLMDEATQVLAEVIQRETDLKFNRIKEYPDMNTAFCRFFEESTKKSIDTDKYLVKGLMPYVGHVPINLIRRRCPEIEKFVKDEKGRGLKNNSINHSLQLVRRVLNLSANEWTHLDGEPWLELAPKIGMLPTRDSRKPYPITPNEEIKLLRELPDHLHRAIKFDLYSGCRESELVGLKWSWLVKADDALWYFRLPESKNDDSRAIILNLVTRGIIEKCAGNHPEFVFSYEGSPVRKIFGSAWKKARVRAGLEKVRGHDLRHTFGMKCLDAGLSEETRAELLGHRAGKSMTAHYSQPNLYRLLEESNKICRPNESLILLKRKLAN